MNNYILEWVYDCLALDHKLQANYLDVLKNMEIIVTVIMSCKCVSTIKWLILFFNSVYFKIFI